MKADGSGEVKCYTATRRGTEDHVEAGEAGAGAGWIKAASSVREGAATKDRSSGDRAS